MSQPVLRQLGVFKMKIINVQKKDASTYKGKSFPAKIAVTFESEDKRLIDGNFKLPLADNKWDDRLMKDLLKVCGAAKISELKDKECAVYIAPYETDDGKVFWNPKGYFKPSYMAAESEDLDSALGAQDALNKAKDPLDDLGF